MDLVGNKYCQEKEERKEEEQWEWEGKENRPGVECG
jgi:hypothetical protein